MATRKIPLEKKPQRKRTAAKSRAAARDERIAAGLIQGKTVSEIAREEQISRAWASAHANSAPVQQIIASLVNSERPRMHRLFLGALQAIEDGFSAKLTVNYKGLPIVMGEDHYARLTAAKRFLEFANAGRAVPKEAEDRENRSFTLDDIKRAIEAEKQQKEPVQ